LESKEEKLTLTSDARPSGSGQNQAPPIGSSEGDLILSDLRRLRDLIITAWEERGVILSRDERYDLQREIKETCELLMELTGRG
jgi:hypothetical protein